MKKILFLSNGHGEDQAAAQIIRALSPGFSISAYPLVGEGKEFKKLAVNLLEPRRNLPGGGFSLRNFWSLPTDLAQGLFTLFYSQIKKLNGLKGQFDLVVAIGDIVPIIGALIVNCPFIFIGINKSDYYHSLAFNYTSYEKYLLKRYAKKVYARDDVTAESLKKESINAVYEGNPIMDGLQMTNEECQMPNGEKGTVGFLPGTRKDDISKNLEDFGKIQAELIRLDSHLKFLVANNPTPFEDVLYNSDVIVGLSGTGNEQAAGIGKPVVSFVGRGSQYNKKFAKAQKQLLGEALALVLSNPMKVAEEVKEILTDRERYEYMAMTGKKRMGEPGAIKKIAQDITNILCS